MIKAGFSTLFWRNRQKNEVDFALEEGEKIIPVEVNLKYHKLESGLEFFKRDYEQATVNLGI